jgi:hypothetical protein
VQIPASAAVEVSVPADARFVQILRSVVAAVASDVDVAFDAVDDLRLAVDESCNALVAAATSRRITMRLLRSDEELVAAISVDGRVATWPLDGIAHGLAWKLISGLTDRANLELVNGDPGIVIAKRTVGRA